MKQREIKFRAPKRVKLLNGGSELVYFDLTDLPKFRQDDLDKVLIELSQQFTGLLDKNGKEIYEGDIVKSSVIIDEKEFNEISKVRYEKTISGWPIILQPFTDDDKEINGFHPGGTKYEVIGNIYENPKLLK